MEKLTLLRSLEARGRPLGTERSTLPSRGTRPEGRNGFARDVDEARRAERSEARRNERKRDTEEPSEDRTSIEEEHGPEEVEPEQVLGDQVLPTDEAASLALEHGTATPEVAAEAPALRAAAPASEAAQTGLAAQASAQAGGTALEAVKLAAAPARPTSLTGPSHRITADLAANLTPEEAALQAALTDTGDGEAEGAGPELRLAEGATADSARTPQRADVVDLLQRVGSERTAPQPAAPTTTDGLATGIEAAPRRDVAAPVQVKAPPASAPTPQAAVDRAADVLRQFRMHLTPSMRQATIHLQPATMGRISIRISMKDGKARTEMRVETDQTLEALQRHVPELKAAFEGHGIETGEFEVALGFGGEESNGSAWSGEQSGAGGKAAASNTASDDTQLASQNLHRALLDETGVDTYA